MQELAFTTSPEDDDEYKLDKNGKKKRTTDRFLETLKGLFESKDQTEKKESAWNRFFKRIDSPDIPKPEYIIEHKSSKPDENLSNTYEAMRTEPEFVIDEDQPALSEKGAVFIDHEPIEGGELIIEHDETNDISVEPETDLSLTSSGGSSKTPEQVGSIVERIGKGPADSSSTAMAQEKLREHNTRRDLKRPSQRSAQQSSRQNALERRQHELENQLQAEIGREDLLEKQLEEERLRNLARVDTKTASTQNIRRSTQAEGRPEPSTQQIKELMGPMPETTRPEDILQRVEAAAESNIPIEQLFERSHEIKDEATNQPLATLNTGSPSRPSYTDAPMLSAQRPKVAQIQSVPQSEKFQTQPQNQDLYRQAMQSGFWGAVAILILILVLNLLK